MHHRKMFPFFLCLFMLATCCHAQKKKSAHDSIKLKKAVSLEKGTKFSTLDLSFSTRNAANNETIISNTISQKRHNFEINAGGGYFIKKYMAVGVSAGYGELKNERLLLDSDGKITQSNEFESGFSVVTFFDYFIPIDNKQRFYLLSRLQLKYTHTSGVVENTTDNVLNRIYTRSDAFGIGVKPGIMVFVVDNFAVITSVGILGLNYKKVKTSKTDKPDGRVSTTDFDLKIDILQLNLGFAVYL